MKKVETYQEKMMFMLDWIQNSNRQFRKDILKKVQNQINQEEKNF